MLQRIALGLAGAVVVFVVCAIVARVWLHGPVTAHTLAVSLDRSVGTGGMAEIDDDCTRTAARTWTCEVTSPEQSGGADYRLRIAPGSSCWSAELVEDYSETRDMPRRPDDCVRLWQWTLWGLL